MIPVEFMEKDKPIDIKFIIKFREKQRLKKQLKILAGNPHPDAMVHSLRVSELLRKIKEL